MSTPKTNAMRMLDKEKIPYQMHTYDASDGHIDGAAVARKVGMDPAKVFKTLVTRGHSGSYYVCVLPVERELDLKKAAKVFSEKSLEMIPVAQLLPTTGYVRGGCSPIGMKKRFATVFDELAKQQKPSSSAAARSACRSRPGPTTSPKQAAASSRRLWRNDDAFDRTKKGR